jgi:hypothetical protein
MNAPVVATQAFLTRRHEKTGVLGGLTGPGPNTAAPRSSLGPQKTSLHTTGSRWSFSHSQVSHLDLSVCGVFSVRPMNSWLSSSACADVKLLLCA